MANRKKARKPRPRKPSAEGVAQVTPPRPRQKQAGPRSAERAKRGGSAIAPTYGERPRAPWHPLPLSELLILVGALGAVIGLRRGVSHGGPPLFAGLVAVALGTLEVTLREHRGGYRSHTLLLSLLPVVVFHTLGVLVLSAFTRLSATLNLVLLGFDVALFALLFRLWRARFVDARRQRAFGGR
jgi:hypothetical protein